MNGLEGPPYDVRHRSRCEPAGLETMTRELVHATRYHSWMFSQVEDFVGKQVLEVGAGSGNLTRLLPATAKVTALDESRAALDVAVTRMEPRQLDTIVADITDRGTATRLARCRFDTILCSNVLEHIEDEQMAVANMHAILRRSRGHLLLIVPAHGVLFGSLDKAAGHFRRYSRRELTKLLKASGFEIRRARYVNALGALAWFVNGSILRTHDLNARSVNAQARLFDRIAVPALRYLESLIRPPFGQSLVVVGWAK